VSAVASAERADRAVGGDGEQVTARFPGESADLMLKRLSRQVARARVLTGLAQRHRGVTRRGRRRLKEREAKKRLKRLLGRRPPERDE
jgi:ribosomal protein S21